MLVAEGQALVGGRHVQGQRHPAACLNLTPNKVVKLEMQSQVKKGQEKIQKKYKYIIVLR